MCYKAGRRGAQARAQLAFTRSLGGLVREQNNRCVRTVTRWDTIADVLPKPWIPEWADMDMHRWADGTDERPPTRDLATRWGWSKSRAARFVLSWVA